MTLLDLDLDAPQPPPRPRPRWIPIAVTVVALVLVSAAAGAVLRTLTAPLPVAAAPEASLSLLEAHFDGGGVATLQVTVRNGDAQPLTVQALRASGVRPDPIEVPVRASIAPGATATMPVQVVPGCENRVTSTPLSATLLLGDGREVAVLPVRLIEAPGALCHQVSQRLPKGWEQPIFGGYAVPQPNGDLNVVSMQQLGDVSVVGVWAGDTLVETRAPIRVTNGRTDPFALRSPDTCVLASNGTAPVGLQLMTSSGNRLTPRYLPLGASLAGWLTARC